MPDRTERTYLQKRKQHRTNKQKNYKIIPSIKWVRIAEMTYMRSSIRQDHFYLSERQLIQ